MKLQVFFPIVALAALTVAAVADPDACDLSLFYEPGTRFLPIPEGDFAASSTIDTTEGTSSFLPDLLMPEEYLDYATLAPKLLKINNWIMEQRSGYQQQRDALVEQGRFFKSSALPSSIETLTKHARNQMFDELARTVISMIKDQIFEQGNHRAAVLTLLDYLAVMGIQYKADPIILYLELTPASWMQTDRVKLGKKISKLLKKSVEKKSKPVTPEIRADYAGRLKSADMVHNWGMHAKIRMDQAHSARSKAQVKLHEAIKEAKRAQMIVNKAVQWGKNLKKGSVPKKGTKWQGDYARVSSALRASLV